MKNFKSFLKQCIAEVIVEPTRKPARRIKSFRSFMKQCIAEVICEPSKKVRKMKVHGSPRKLQMAQIIKECTLEVLRENLNEAFDPSSQGPNVPQENPYPAWNAQMAKLEEGDTIFKDRQGGQWVYWMDNSDTGGRIAVSPQNVRKYMQQGYRLVALEPWNDPNSMKDIPDKGIMGEGPVKEWMSTYSREGKTPAEKVRRAVYYILGRSGFHQEGSTPNEYMEYYLNGFATVYCNVGVQSKTVGIQRYYDSERLDTMTGNHIEEQIPIPEVYSKEFVAQIVKRCLLLKKSVRGDESIFGGMDDLHEGIQSKSASIQWKCPHCRKPTGILIESESPSDYIACADCEHCSKEINDPRLDKAVYEVVMKHYKSTH